MAPLEPAASDRAAGSFLWRQSRRAPLNRPMFDLTLDGAVARLRLDRPEARNAIPVHGWALLAHRCGEAARSGARLLILSGNARGLLRRRRPRGFSGLRRPIRQARRRFRRLMRAGLDAAARPADRRRSRAIEGPCYGAGVALAMACDIRVAGPGARFAITPAKFGISYPQEDVARLVALVGPGQASRLLLGAGTIDSAEAARIGLVELAPADVGRGRRGAGRRDPRQQRRKHRRAEAGDPPRRRGRGAATTGRTAASTPCSARPISASGWRRFGRAADLPARRQ